MDIKIKTESEIEIQTSEESGSDHLCMSRRNFLLTGSSAIVLSTMPGIATAVKLAAKDYPRVKIASLRELQTDQPVDFSYPPNNPISTFFIVKLGEEAGGGIGRKKDIVAFSNLCSHMGGPLNGTYKAAHKAMGPCPLHLTTFDLTRHGMVISGHATEALPQARLEISRGNVYAVGVTGLIYGQHDNLG
ncbi:Arsenite oxidase small subunit precursor [hydrothermal vent metagenome]|uniref:Arsenite oxidase small subunit n=1 Tax=hydrothermal vent metagenome TaxID=652676 RepID=A0A3B0WKQ2_9ZZZZ